MKLLERYASQTGLRIGKQYLPESFYPLPFERYITIHASSGMQAKNYPHYNEVIGLLAPALKELGIAIVQLGGKDEPALRGAHHLQGVTSIQQSNYVLSRAILHVGNDSWLAHRAGELSVPLVAVYGSTTVANHSPYRVHPKSQLLESHRWGKQATFASQEMPQTIGLIAPEIVANAVLAILGAAAVTHCSLSFGDHYYDALVETVPDVVVGPQVQIGGPLVVRMDYLFNEDVLLKNLQLRKCAVISNREIDVAKLAALKPHLSSMRVVIDQVSPAWIKAVKRLGVPLGFVSDKTDEAKVRQMRLDYSEACMFDPYVRSTKDDFLKAAASYLNLEKVEPDMATLRFKTHKVLLAGEKAYLSKAHWLAGQPSDVQTANSAPIIDSPDFWADTAHHYYYTP